jgi:hypothetical protein
MQKLYGADLDIDAEDAVGWSVPGGASSPPGAAPLFALLPRSAVYKAMGRCRVAPRGQQRVVDAAAPPPVNGAGVGGLLGMFARGVAYVPAGEGCMCYVDCRCCAGGGRRPLFNAAANGNVDVVAHLVSSGASLDATDANGRTALHW